MSEPERKATLFYQQLVASLADDEHELTQCVVKAVVRAVRKGNLPQNNDVALVAIDTSPSRNDEERLLKGSSFKSVDLILQQSVIDAIAKGLADQAIADRVKTAQLISDEVKTIARSEATSAISQEFTDKNVFDRTRNYLQTNTPLGPEDLMAELKEPLKKLVETTTTDIRTALDTIIDNKVGVGTSEPVIVGQLTTNNHGEMLVKAFVPALVERFKEPALRDSVIKIAQETVSQFPRVNF